VSVTILLLFVSLLPQHDGLFGQKSTVYIRLFRTSPIYIELFRKRVSEQSLSVSSSSLSSAPSASFCVVGSLLANESQQRKRALFMQGYFATETSSSLSSAPLTWVSIAGSDLAKEPCLCGNFPQKRPPRLCLLLLQHGSTLLGLFWQKSPVYAGLFRKKDLLLFVFCSDKMVLNFWFSLSSLLAKEP